MSLLWTQAMAWHNTYSQDRHDYHPISVRKAGFAGLVGDQDWEDEMREGSGENHEDFDEDLYDKVSPEPDHEEKAHYDEHGEYPESYFERHDQAYGKAVQDKKNEDRLDHDDPALMGFVREHGSNSELWHDYGRSGKINLHQPVYATQSHVADEHIQRYMHDPHGISHHRSMYPGAHTDYLGEEHPMFVTHEGRLHVTEGHHRVAAALRRGDREIHGHHFSLDEHPQFEHGEGLENE